MSLRVGRGSEYNIDIDQPLSAHDRQYLADRDTRYRDILRTGEVSAEGQVPESYEDWTVAQLQDELAARELPTGGRKGELVNRLAENDQANPAA